MKARDYDKVTVEVKVDGTPCNFSFLQLRQTMFGHHTFVVGGDFCTKDQIFKRPSSKRMQKLLGCALSIRIKDEEYGLTDFEGVIREVDTGDQGMIMIYGGSPTIMMADDYSMASFVENDLASIVKQTIVNVECKIEYKIELQNNCEIPYAYRYNESSYDFLNRLLSACGECFFYDGKKIIVGCFDGQDTLKPVSLSCKHDLSEMNVSFRLNNNHVEHTETKSLNKFIKNVLSLSKFIYGDYTIFPNRVSANCHAFNLLENSVYGNHYGNLSEKVMFKAKTHTCKVALGKVISIDTDLALPGFFNAEKNFRIVEIVHNYDTMGHYENEIVGISTDADYIPSWNVVLPMAVPEVAEVVDNQDPEKQGRVKVQYVWQQQEVLAHGGTSGWMRVHLAGMGSCNTLKDKHSFSVLEIGEQVMVVYEYGNPNRPFVIRRM